MYHTIYAFYVSISQFLKRKALLIIVKHEMTYDLTDYDAHHRILRLLFDIRKFSYCYNIVVY